MNKLILPVMLGLLLTACAHVEVKDSEFKYKFEKLLRTWSPPLSVQAVPLQHSVGTTCEIRDGDKVRLYKISDIPQQTGNICFDGSRAGIVTDRELTDLSILAELSDKFQINNGERFVTISLRRNRAGLVQSFGFLRPYRAYLRGKDIPPPRLAAYGVVVLHARPTPATEQRLQRFCTSYVNTLPQFFENLDFVPPDKEMLTIWPIDNPIAPEVAKNDCKYVLNHYDLSAGISAMQDAQKQGARFDGEGPYLVGWSPSNTRGVKDRLVMVVDMSGFSSQDSFDKALNFWQGKVVKDPEMWRSGFSLEKFPILFRDWLDYYGEAGVNTFKLLIGRK